MDSRRAQGAAAGSKNGRRQTAPAAGGRSHGARGQASSAALGAGARRTRARAPAVGGGRIGEQRSRPRRDYHRRRVPLNVSHGPPADPFAARQTRRRRPRAPIARGPYRAGGLRGIRVSPSACDLGSFRRSFGNSRTRPRNHPPPGHQCQRRLAMRQRRLRSVRRRTAGDRAHHRRRGPRGRFRRTFQRNVLQNAYIHRGRWQS